MGESGFVLRRRATVPVTRRSALEHPGTFWNIGGFVLRISHARERMGRLGIVWQGLAWFGSVWRAGAAAGRGASSGGRVVEAHRGSSLLLAVVRIRDHVGAAVGLKRWIGC